MDKNIRKGSSLPVFLSSILGIFCYAGLDWYALHTIVFARHDEDLILVS